MYTTSICTDVQSVQLLTSICTIINFNLQMVCVASLIPAAIAIDTTNEIKEYIDRIGGTLSLDSVGVVTF